MFENSIQSIILRALFERSNLVSTLLARSVDIYSEIYRIVCMMCDLQRYTDIPTHLHPAQSVSVPMLPRATSSVVTN